MLLTERGGPSCWYPTPDSWAGLSGPTSPSPDTCLLERPILPFWAPNQLTSPCEAPTLVRTFSSLPWNQPKSSLWIWLLGQCSLCISVIFTQISKHFAKTLLTHFLKVDLCVGGGQLFLKWTEVGSGAWVSWWSSWYHKICQLGVRLMNTSSALDSIYGTQISTEKEAGPGWEWSPTLGFAELQINRVTCWWSSSDSRFFSIKPTVPLSVWEQTNPSLLWWKWENEVRQEMWRASFPLYVLFFLSLLPYSPSPCQ